MAKPEGATTILLRSTMDLDLDEVNTKLIAAGEKAIDSSTLGKRRAWIRAKDSGKHDKRKAAKKKTAKKKTAKAKGKFKAVRAARRLPPMTEPRKGTFGAFVYNLPYDMDVHEVMKRAKSAGVKGHSATVYKVRSKYPKNRSPTLNDIASAESLREQDAARRQQLTVAPAVATREASLSSARSQFVLLLMRLGLDVAEALIQDYKRAHDRLEATIAEGLKH